MNTLHDLFDAPSAESSGPIGSIGTPGTLGPPGQLRKNAKYKIKNIHIKECDVGYIVEVGCQTFAITSKDILLRQLINYINNPSELEQEYNNGQDLFDD